MNNKEFNSKFTSSLFSFLNTCVVLYYLVLTTGTVVERCLRIRPEHRILTGHKSLTKIGIPMVQITGNVRTSLREIYERVPHDSAASASAELLKKHTSNNSERIASRTLD